jgi:hypothetical protein
MASEPSATLIVAMARTVKMLNVRVYRASYKEPASVMSDPTGRADRFPRVGLCLLATCGGQIFQFFNNQFGVHRISPKAVPSERSVGCRRFGPETDSGLL